MTGYGRQLALIGVSVLTLGVPGPASGSTANNGSVRAGFGRHKEARFNYLLRRPSPEGWRAELSENGRELTLTILPGPPQSWRLDLTGGAVLKEHATDVPSQEGVLRRVSTLTVHEGKEAGPEIRLPEESQVLAGDKVDEEGTTVPAGDQVVEAPVDEPEIDDYFCFSWPEPAPYYDDNLGTEVIPYLMQRELARRLGRLGDDLPAPAAAEAVPTEMKASPDGIAAADAPARGGGGGWHYADMQEAGRILGVGLLVLAALLASGGCVWWRRQRALRVRR